MSDPSSLLAFGGIDAKLEPQTKPTTGISVVALRINVNAPGKPARSAVAGALPEVGESLYVQSPPVYTWKGWDKVEFKPYFKQAYYTLQKDFATLVKPLPAPAAKSPNR
jgi:hypothetical protein